MAQDQQETIDAQAAKDAATANRTKNAKEIVNSASIPNVVPISNIENIRMQAARDKSSTLNVAPEITASGASIEEASRMGASNKYINPIIDESGQTVFVDNSGRLPDGSTPIQARNLEGSFIQPGQTTLPTSTPTSTQTPVTSTKRSSAFDAFKSRFVSMGLGDLADSLIKLSQSEDAPTTADGFYLALLDTKAYKDRFGNTNEMRVKNGLQALTESQIMGLEDGYKKTMKAYGLPAGFYDSPQDYQKFISNDLSVSELADRVQAAHVLTTLTDPTIKQQLFDYYGITPSQLTAYQLDPTKGQDILNQMASKNTVATAAATAGMGAQQAQAATGMGAADLTFAQQAQGFQKSLQLGQQVGNLASIYGGNYGTSQAIEEAFKGPNAEAAAQQRAKLAQQELNQFGGSAGVDKSTLSSQSVIGSI